MGVLDYIYTTFLVIWSKYDAAIIGGFLLAFVISSIRTLREGDYQFWEGVMCGIISAVVWLSATALGIPVGLNAIVSGIIGYFGSQATMQFLKHRLFGGFHDSNNKEL